MEYKISRDLHMPYLRAIQKIPGNTANEKLSWIGRLASCQDSKDLEQFPPELLPILRIEIALKKKKHEDITSALKSEDSAIINRAFKAYWFFDGSHKEIVNVRYFCEHLFPYVSVNTRTRIVLTLAHRLSGKDPVFAQEMFTAVVSMYGIQAACPLIIACDETFVYKIVVEKKLVLPVKIVKKLLYKNPDLVVRFLKLLKRDYKQIDKRDATDRDPFAIGIDRYKYLLPKLMKKRLEAFVELFEIHETQLPDIVLSNTCADIFLKKARQYLIQKPSVFIRILPLKKINEDLMEKIFPALLPTEISSFKTNSMLDYLKHYPRDKQYDLLRKSYKNKYDADLLNDTDKVTSALLQLLPTEERIKQARIQAKRQKNYYEGSSNYSSIATVWDYETVWICYLPVNETIPVIKENLNKTENETDRYYFLLQMIYVCKINKDDDALFNTLTYILNRHKNENYWLFEKIFYELLQMFDLPHLKEKLISPILDMVRLYFVKRASVPEEILSVLIHFKLIHNMPIEELFDMFLESNLDIKIDFNILKECPQYERQRLVTFANQIEKKCFRTIDDRNKNFCLFVEAIYDFNSSCKKSCIKIEEMTIRDYPWLMNGIYEIICSEEKSWNVKNILQKNEPELYCNWFPSAIVNVTSGAARALLKRDLQDVLDNWEKYLADCMENYCLKQVQCFIKTTRWYKDLPIKFAEHCMNYVYDMNRDKISSSLVILALLFHGDELTKLIEPLIPIETTIDINYSNAKNNYEIVKKLPLSMRLSNPSISLDLVVRLCVGDYLSIALMTLINVSRRTSLPKVISVAQKLTSMRVSTRKHGIRLMYLVASIHEFTDFLQKTWATETHHSVRQVLFEAFQKLFFTNPCFETWSLYRQTMSTLNLNDEALLLKIKKIFPKIPNEYVEDYLNLWLKTIDNFRGMGLHVEKTNKYIVNFLTAFDTAAIFNVLSEEFVENILRRFLFHSQVFDTARDFAIWYILSKDQDKCAARIKIFANIFRNTVITYSNVPQNSSFSYPINKAVCSFIENFVIIYIKKFCFDNYINLEVISNMQMIFLSVSSPKQDAKSYLLLIYAKNLQECILTKDSFGLKLGQQLHELIDIFSSLFVPFMAEILKYFIDKVYEWSEREEATLSVIEGLIEADNTDSCFMAVTMLPSRIHTKYKARYDRIIKKFQRMHEEPVITTVLCKHLNDGVENYSYY